MINFAIPKRKMDLQISDKRRFTPNLALQITTLAIQQGAVDLLARLLVVSNPEVRAAAVYALGTLIQASASEWQH